jgi:hypothetical protein
VTNTEPENPFRGGHLLLDSVNSRVSDFAHPDRPAPASVPQQLGESGDRVAIDMDESPADSPEKSMVITKKQEEIQFFQDDAREIHHEDYDYREDGADEEQEDEPEAGFEITQHNEELLFGVPQEGDIGRIDSPEEREAEQPDEEEA